MSDDVHDDPEFKAWAKSIRVHLLPKLEKSALSLTLVPRGETDVKFAVELGLSIMLDKPIIAVVERGTTVPERLRRVADEIVEVEYDTPEASETIRAAIVAAIARIEASQNGASEDEGTGTDG